MGANFEEDLDCFFDEFAVDVTAGAVEMKGIFVTPSDGIQFDNVSVESDQPMVRVQTAELATSGVARKGAITVNGNDYIIGKIRAEGAGTSIVWLEKV